MVQSSTENRKCLLASRPHGAPTAENFNIEKSSIPQIADGQVLLRIVYLSLDPYMRGRMSAGPSYAAGVEIGTVMTGSSVSRVMESKNPKFKVNDWVLGETGWQDYCVSNGDAVRNLGQDVKHPSHYLGVLGMTGLTAYGGFLQIGKPKEGETVVVAAATGAVGSVVGQIAKIKGCRVVGIAGGKTKCDYAVENFGFDACIDHRSPKFSEELSKACPSGIDVYFENVGGMVFDAVLPLLNTKARVPVCGLISSYNATELPSGPDRTGLLMRTILIKRITMQGFIVFQDFADQITQFTSDMGKWVSEGQVKAKEDFVWDLEDAPDAFIGLLEGKNFGKLVVQVGEE